jgi:hypothetical protein
VVAQGLLVCLLAAGRAHLCYGDTKRGWKSAWKVSIALFGAANVLDARSSAGHNEANPLLRNGQGRLSVGRWAEIRSAASGG